MISPSKWKQLEARMIHCGIKESEIFEKFIRSSGNGGQNVNKVNSCVYLQHLPSQIEVKCQKTRSQQDNRYLARVILCDKWQAMFQKKQSQKEREIYKLKKQKQRRSKKAKQKIRVLKENRSQTKELRQTPRHE